MKLARAGSCIAADLREARSFAGRLRGLMFRRAVPGDGLLFRPAGSIHTAFVRFPIDVLFLDRAGRVLKACRRVPPWRLRLAPRRAALLVELPAGTLARHRVHPGDPLTLQP